MACGSFRLRYLTVRMIPAICGREEEREGGEGERGGREVNLLTIRSLRLPPIYNQAVVSMLLSATHHPDTPEGDRPFLESGV